MNRYLVYFGTDISRTAVLIEDASSHTMAALLAEFRVLALTGVRVTARKVELADPLADTYWGGGVT